MPTTVIIEQGLGEPLFLFYVPSVFKLVATTEPFSSGQVELVEEEPLVRPRDDRVRDKHRAVPFARQVKTESVGIEDVLHLLARRRLQLRL